MSTPTASRSGWAWSAEPTEPRVSASTTEAPPWSSPYGWVLPSTGIVATTRSAEISTSSMPILSLSPPMPWGICADELLDASGATLLGHARPLLPDRPGCR